MPEPAVYVLEKMAHGFSRMGRDQGAGFYDYPSDAPANLWSGLKVFARSSRRAPSRELAVERLLYAQAIEAIRCLQEGVIASAHDADIGSIHGCGFPEGTGGAAQFVNGIGMATFVARARELASRFGDRFEPPALLVRLAEEGRSL
jgi:3-hydroxyacyl-CoA dehydrogenase/enoyl-CoA hydratase/3-hydroxybutyryl-CoA epimerase